MINLKEFKLNEGNSKHSQHLVDVYENIFNELEIYEQKKREATNNIKGLKNQLLKLADDMVLNAIDEKELKKIKDKRRELQYEIDDLQLIYEMDVDNLIKKKYDKTVQELNSSLGDDEFKAYKNKITLEKERIKREYEEDLRSLEQLLNNHPLLRLRQLQTKFAYLGRK